MGTTRTIRHLMGAVGLVAAIGCSQPAMAGDDDGRFMIRLQGTAVITQDSLKSLTSSALGDLKALGFDAEVSNVVIPSATLSYFFNKNWAVELFCCFSKHQIDLKPPAAFAGLTGEVAETWIFPPILTLQYHFTGMGAFKPYVGAGVQFIHFFNEKPGANALNATSVNMTDAFGPALQAGIDIGLGGGWYLNADVKKTWLDTKVSWLNSVGGTIVAKDQLDPLTVSIGLGYRFDWGHGQIDPLK